MNNKPHCASLVVPGERVCSAEMGSEPIVRFPGVCRNRMAALMPPLLRKLPLGDAHGEEPALDQERHREKRNECAGEGIGGDVGSEVLGDRLNEPDKVPLNEPPPDPSNVISTLSCRL